GRERARARIIARERLLPGARRLPAAVRDRNAVVAFPRRSWAALAAGVRELHAGAGALGMNEPDDPFDRLGVSIAPDPEIVGTDPSLGRHRGGFSEDERGAADGAAPEVDEMPVVREAVDARVLAHRRDDDPIRKRESPERESIEQVRHERSRPQLYLRDARDPRSSDQDK